MDKYSCPRGSAACMRGVVKCFGRKCVLRGVSFTVNRGEVFVLAGLNGAGKSTSMRILLGIVKRDSGHVEVLGAEPGGRGWGDVKRRIGYLPEDAQPYQRLTGLENLRFFAGLYARSEAEAAAMVRRAVEISGLSMEDLRRKAGSYSKGMKRRLLIAATLMHEPELAVLDEPTSGLDVVASFRVRELIRRLRGTGTTFIITTHELRDAQELADRVAFIHKGRIVFEGSVGEALDRYSASSLEEAFVRAVSGDGGP